MITYTFVWLMRVSSWLERTLLLHRVRDGFTKDIYGTGLDLQKFPVAISRTSRMKNQKDSIVLKNVLIW